MHECHSAKKRYHGRKHDLVIEEQLLGAYISATNTKHNDCYGVECAPPAYEESGFVFVESPRSWSLTRKPPEEVHGGGVVSMGLWLWNELSSAADHVLLKKRYER